MPDISASEVLKLGNSYVSYESVAEIATPFLRQEIESDPDIRFTDRFAQLGLLNDTSRLIIPSGSADSGDRLLSRPERELFQASDSIRRVLIWYCRAALTTEDWFVNMTSKQAWCVKSTQPRNCQATADHGPRLYENGLNQTRPHISIGQSYHAWLKLVVPDMMRTQDGDASELLTALRPFAAGAGYLLADKNILVTYTVGSPG